MANQVFPSYRNAMLASFADGKAYRIAAISSVSYTPRSQDAVLADVPLDAILATSDQLVGAVTQAGKLLFDSAATFPAGIAGGQADALLLYEDSGNSETSRLIWYADTIIGLPFEPTQNPLLFSFPTGLITLV